MFTGLSVLIKKRRFNYCVCDDCFCEFKRRSEKLNLSWCKACTNKRAGIKRKTHGHNNKNSRLHVIWSNMKRRCVNPTNKEYKTYGGKSIKLCREWFSYENFMEWSYLNGYKRNLTIDRIDNSLGYFPFNCRWVDYSTQNANRDITDKNKTGYIGVTAYGKYKYRSKVYWRGVAYEVGIYKCKKLAAVHRDIFIIDREWPHKLNFSKEFLERTKKIFNKRARLYKKRFR